MPSHASKILTWCFLKNAVALIRVYNAHDAPHWPLCLVVLTLSLLGETFRLLIPFANSLDTDQDQQNVGPDLRTHRMSVLIWIQAVRLSDSVLKKTILKNVSRRHQKHGQLPNIQRVKALSAQVRYSKNGLVC